MTENKNSDKVNEKLFLIIKSGPGFMGSLMYSLIKDMADIGSYNYIKDSKKVHIQMNSYGHHVLL
jgi:hypothetical protein